MSQDMILTIDVVWVTKQTREEMMGHMHQWNFIGLNFNLSVQTPFINSHSSACVVGLARKGLVLVSRIKTCFLFIYFICLFVWLYLYMLVYTKHFN